MKNIRKIIENTENFNVNGKQLKESDKIKKWLLDNTNLFKMLVYQVKSNIWEKNNEKIKMFKPNLSLKNDKNEELKMNVLCPVLRKVGGRKQKRGEIFFAPTS